MPERAEAFTQRESGLFVPPELQRDRQVWTKDEGRLLERATKMLEAKGVRLYLGCDHAACTRAPIERIRDQAGGLILRCAHLDRQLQRAF
jgi:hypothetical protein